MKKILKKAGAILLAAAVAVTMVPVASPTGQASAETVSSPRVTAESTTWDCVYFGSYPQTEIVSEPSQCGTYGQYWGQASDYKVDPALYAQLESASYNVNGDTTINGTKYRRIMEDDITALGNPSDVCYNWSDSITYHYFRYEKIKWRVLDVNGDNALLLADKGLDDQPYDYYSRNEGITWETCTIRSWLNGYGASYNKYGVDFTSKNFIDSAFSSFEQNAIISSTLENRDNIEFGTEGGNDTSDKVFILSESDVWNTDRAVSYGFVKEYDTYAKQRRAKSSTYAKAMGVTSAFDDGFCSWLLRSPGYYSILWANVTEGGWIDSDGYNRSPVQINYAVRPALHLNLKSDVWSYAGTIVVDVTSDVVDPVEPAEEENPAVVNPETQQVAPAALTSSDVSLSYASTAHTGSACKPGVTVKSGSKVLKAGTDYKVSYANNVNVGTASVTVTGIGAYTGTVKKTFKIVPAKITSMALSTSSYVYTGEVRKPAVTVKAGNAVVASKISRSNDKVSISYASGRKNVGTYKVTVKGVGNYTGTLTKSFTVYPKGAVILTPKKLKKGFTAKWKKKSGVTGYQVRYSLKKNFKSGVKKKTVKGYKKTSVKVTKLKAKKTYYVQVRTYKTVNGKKYYSKWSKTKSVKTK